MALKKAIATLQASGKDVRVLSSYPLHKDLTTFINCVDFVDGAYATSTMCQRIINNGGLTSLLGLVPSERQACEALISSTITSDTLNGTVAQR